MTKILNTLRILLLALAFPQAPTWAQEDPALATLRGSLSASTYTSFTALMREARESRLPTEPLIQKVREGVAKQVPEDRILLAVRATRDRLIRAQVLLRTGEGAVAAAELSAIADVLQRGVPESAITELLSRKEGRASIVLAGHGLAELLAQGVPVDVSVDLISAWQTEGANPERLKEIAIAVSRLVRQGVVPGQAGAALAAGLRLGRAPGSIGPPDIPGILRGIRGGRNRPDL